MNVKNDESATKWALHRNLDVKVTGKVLKGRRENYDDTCDPWIRHSLCI